MAKQVRRLAVVGAALLVAAASTTVASGANAAAPKAVTPVPHTPSTRLAPPRITAISPKSGFTAGNTFVTITGSGFSGVTRVTFGAAKGTQLQRVSKHKLYVFSPAHHLGKVTVRVHSKHGTSARTAQDRYTFVAVPPLKVTQVPHRFTFAARSASCASASFCLAVGDNTFSGPAAWSTYKGASWSRPVAFHGPDLSDVSCPSITLCLGLGYASDGKVVSESFDGSHWGPAVRLPRSWVKGSYVEFDTDCASPTMCLAIAVGDDERSMGAAMFDGTAWTTVAVPPLARDVTASSLSMSCYAEQRCTVVGARPGHQSGDAYTSTFRRGFGWSSPIATGIEDMQISCTSVSFCLGVGLLKLDRPVTAWSVLTGNAWSAHATLGTVFDPDGTAVTCLNANWCLLVGAGGAYGRTMSDVFTGSSWSPSRHLTDFGGGRVLTCATRTSCFAGLGEGALVGYTGTWGNQAAFPGVPSVVSCTSRSFCLAGDYAGRALVYRHRAWAPLGAATGLGSVSGISCTSPNRCVAVGDAIAPSAVEWDGHTWTDPVRLVGAASLGAVSCTSRRFCMAVGTSPNRRPAGSPRPTPPTKHHTIAFRFNGATWSTKSTVTALVDSSEVSCSSSRLCVAVGARISGVMEAVVYNGTSWSMPSPSARTDSMIASCARRAAWCAAVDPGPPGGTFVFHGTKWSTRATPPFEIFGVSCVRAHGCVGVGTDDGSSPRAWLFTRHGWSEAVPVRYARGALLTASCPSMSFCAAISAFLGD